MLSVKWYLDSRFRLQDGQLTHRDSFRSGSAVGSGSLASIGTGSGSVDGVRTSGEGLGRSSEVDWVTGTRIDHDWMVVVG